MRLRVLSLNVWALPSPVGRYVAERLAHVVHHLAELDCDLALFQEAWTDEAREILVEGGARNGYPHHFMQGEARSGGGLLALSRHPIEGSRFRRFTLCGLPQRLTQMDYYSGKGVARVDVRPSGIPVSVFNTHMHARYAPSWVQDDYFGHRTGEVIELADEVRAVSGPVIAVGDFNMQDTAREYGVLQGLTGLSDAATLLDARLPTSTLQNPYRVGRGALSESRIDYVFCRDGVARGVVPLEIERHFNETVEIAGKPGAASDHAGLLAEIEIGEPGHPMPAIPPEVVARARSLLDEGRELARRRRLEERLGAGASVVVASGAVAAARHARLSRRTFLRRAAWTLAAGSLAGGAGLLGLAERVVGQELAGYDTVEAVLDRIAASSTPPQS